MIKEKYIDINISYRNMKHYKEKGYKPILHNKLNIKVSDLPNVSHQKITGICDICKSEKEIPYYKYLENKNRFNYYGCKKCSNEKRKKTSLKKYGVDNYMKSDECKEKVANNNIKKYGVKTTLLEKETQDKIKTTIQKKYGVNEILSSDEIREKGKKTLLKKYGVEHYNKTIDFYKKTYYRWEKNILIKLKKYNINNFILKQDRTVDIKCDCGKEHYFNITSKTLYQRKEIQKTILCTICNSIISQKQSSKEIEIINFIKNNYKGDILENDKSLISEIDIYIPEYKFGLEINGIYWHSDIYKNKDYHLNKTEECEKNGIQLFHIYEDEWIYKQEIVKSMILNKLNKITNKIYARKTEIKEITDNKLIRKFLNENHIQGFVGSKIKVGLFFDNELISLMTFGKRRIAMGKKLTIDGEYELLRFCNKLNTNVIGGASKLFKYFIKNYQPKEITTYADRSYSQGKLYEILGFKYQGKTQPNYCYYDSKQVKHNRFNYRKDVLVKMGYDSNKTEFDIMDELKYMRVYNSGNLKYLYKQN